MSLAAVTTANPAPTRGQQPAHETTDRGPRNKIRRSARQAGTRNDQSEMVSKAPAADATAAAADATTRETVKASRLAAFRPRCPASAGGANFAQRVRVVQDDFERRRADQRGQVAPDAKIRSQRRLRIAAVALAPAAAVKSTIGAANALADSADDASTTAKGRADDGKAKSAANADRGCRSRRGRDRAQRLRPRRADRPVARVCRPIRNAERRERRDRGQVRWKLVRTAK